MNDTDRTHKENKLEQDITLPYLKKAVIFSITFGFFGVNMAFALQSAMMGRIFQTLGANPNNLGWFFILPPLVGMIVQPLIGYYSDRTWTRIWTSYAVSVNSWSDWSNRISLIT